MDAAMDEANDEMLEAAAEAVRMTSVAKFWYWVLMARGMDAVAFQ
jgi:hypothetical protein